jgi:hypothetical protein
MDFLCVMDFIMTRVFYDLPNLFFRGSKTPSLKVGDKKHE